MTLESHRRSRLVRLASAVTAGLTLACTAAIHDGSGPAEPATDSAGAPALERPSLELPPRPSRRTDEEIWQEALGRAEALEPLVREDIANVRPGPLPRNEATASGAVETERGMAPPQAAEATGAAVPYLPEARETQRRSRGLIPRIEVVQTYTMRDGLPSNRVTAIYVDDEDAWIGTADAGLARLNFAEENWIITGAEDGLGSARVSDVTKYKGMYFVGTDEGLSIWDGASWNRQTHIGKTNIVNPVFVIHEGILWVASRTMRGGLLSFDGENWKNESTKKPGTVLNNVAAFSFSEKSLWIGTTNRGVHRFDGKSWKTFTVADGIASNFVYTLASKDNRCYLGGCCGLSVFEGEGWKIYDIAEGLAHSTVNAIRVDGDIVWLGSKKGLSLFDGFDFVNYYVGDGLTDDRITSIYARGEHVWVGTANGLNVLRKD